MKNPKDGLRYFSLFLAAAWLGVACGSLADPSTPTANNDSSTNPGNVLPGADNASSVPKQRDLPAFDPNTAAVIRSSDQASPALRDTNVQAGSVQKVNQVMANPGPSQKSNQVMVNPGPTQKGNEVGISPGPAQKLNQVMANPEPQQKSNQVMVNPGPSQKGNEGGVSPGPIGKSNKKTKNRKGSKVSASPGPLQKGDMVGINPGPINKLSKKTKNQKGSKVSVSPGPVQKGLKVGAQPGPQQKLNVGAQTKGAGTGDMSQNSQLKLQQAMDQKSKMSQTLSNVLKKNQDTEKGVVGNMK